MISAVAETSGASIDEVKFHVFKVTKFWKEWKVWPTTPFLVFVLFVGNFSNKHHYNLKILRIFCFWYFCPKWLFPKLLVLKVDLCIKVVALIKITTVVWRFLFQTKKLLLVKLGREIENLGIQESVSLQEENTLIKALCDLLDRIWSHGLAMKKV